MIIDAYSHVCPKELAEAIAEANPTGEVKALDNSYLWDGERRLEYMDKHQIDWQVLTLVRPPMWLGMEPSTIHRLTRLANDSIAALAVTHSDRFVGVAVLPMVDDTMIEELRRARFELGLEGVMIFSNIEGQPLDDPSMWPLYQEAATMELPIWIHPQHGHSYPWIKRDLLDRMFGWPFETSLAMARLVYGGVLEAFPDLAFITHHLGGMVPYCAGRIDHMDHDRSGTPSALLGDTSDVALTGRVIEHFRRFYADTMVGGEVSALRCGLDFFGADRVMYGTDFPMGANDGEDGPVFVLDSIHALDLAPADEQLILSGNVLRVLHRA